MGMPINTIILLLFLVGIIVLQVFLSRVENKWLGLIIPAIFVMFSFILVLGRALYLNESILQSIVQILIVFIVYNIPTIIFIGIYFACREKFKKNKEIDKMNIQDLE